VRYVELFAGGGGLSHGLDRAGHTCVAHAEIEPHARAVLRARWPDVPLLGDVRDIAGATFAGAVDIVSGGSPCQDLSVAGKRAGMTEGSGTRSALYFEQLRIWRESRAPYFLWENVAGAFSSNNGYDFAAVLSAVVGRDLVADGSIRPDKRGKLKWLRAGRAVGPAGVAAWRVFDLQHFGPPQRRVRVFVIGARTGGVDPGEILALGEGVCGHPSPREQAREATTGGAAPGAVAISNSSTCGIGLDRSFTLSAGRRQQHGVVAFHLTQEPINSDIAPAFGCSSGGAGVVAFKPSHYTRGKDGSSHSFVLAHGQANAEIGVGISPSLTLLHEAPIAFTARPRRLTPRECERLMGWPDDWTRYGVREDGAPYAMSDTARYRICGNGVGAPVAEWIGRQFSAVADAYKRKTQSQRQTALLATLEQMAAAFREAGELTERTRYSPWLPSAASDRVGARKLDVKAYTLMGQALSMHRAAVRAAVRDARRRF